MMRGSALDNWLASWARRSRAPRAAARSTPLVFCHVDTPAGKVRYTDTGGARPVVVFVPDGPNVIEHYQALMAQLAASCRVVCFDMPGFGFSVPGRGYSHSLDEGASAVRAVLDHLNINKATLAFSCANGFYALRLAELAPERVCGLLLAQTPSLDAIPAWTDRIVPKALRIPFTGQLLGWLFREKAALGWYRIALPQGTDAKPFINVARTALRCGACFSLAGVVQGLLKEEGRALAIGKVPCTVIWGRQDRSHWSTNPWSLVDIVPHAQVLVLEACGHFPDLENRNVYAKLLVERVALWDCRAADALVSTAPQESVSA